LTIFVDIIAAAGRDDTVLRAGLGETAQEHLSGGELLDVLVGLARPVRGDGLL
jgi:hypothetical protein